MTRFGLGVALAATLLWAIGLATGAVAQEPVAVPKLAARVTDLTATFSAEQKLALESRLAAIDAAGGAQIAVLLLPTTQPETIEQFGIRLAEAWKIGHKNSDNGVIVIIAKQDRRARIEVGYGLEGAIPDAVAKRIVAEQMTPYFKQGDYFGGLQASVELLYRAARGEAMPSLRKERPSSLINDGGQALIVAFMVALGLGSAVRKLFGLAGSFVIAAGIGWAVFAFGGSLLLAIVIGIASFALTFINFGGRGIGGGFGGFGGGFGGGGGGFSGGGGSFGGGGASGSW